MTENKHSTAPVWYDPDDAPDLSAPEWQKKIAAAEVKRGRPKAETTKVSTTIRLDPEVIGRLKAQGSGWQSRINAVLKGLLSDAREPHEVDRVINLLHLLLHHEETRHRYREQLAAFEKGGRIGHNGVDTTEQESARLREFIEELDEIDGEIESGRLFQKGRAKEEA